MYGMLIAEPEAAATGPLLENGPARRAEIERIAGYRTALANQVVLLEQLRATLAALAAAVRMPRSAGTLAALSEASTDLLVQAEAARRAYAVLRNRSIPTNDPGVSP
jgi:hypothetical protein